MFAALPTSQTILLSMGLNAKRMMQYEWKQRITVFRRGNPSEPIIDQVRFDSNGQMQRTTISAPQERQMGGIRGRIASGVREEVKGIMELAGRYNKPQQLMEAIRSAHISEEPGSNTTVVQATNILDSTDSMTMHLDSRTNLATNSRIQTHYQGSPMNIAQEYSPLPDGPNVMRSMKVSVPDKGLEINVDSYDFAQQKASNEHFGVPK
jgi:hypothetical protein